MPSRLVDIPLPARATALELAFEVIDRASLVGSERWGLTYYDQWCIRVNVGWTEVFTASRDEMRLIVDLDLAKASSPRLAYDRGKDPRGFYPTIPGSALVRLSYTRAQSLATAIQSLRPALYKAIALSARRRVGRGVRAGHNQWAVAQIAAELGKPSPSPGYGSLRGSHVRSTAAALSLMEGALKRVVSSRYERNGALRRACVNHYGFSCAVCGFSFQEVFGSIGASFVHVHHITPLSTSGPLKVHPVRDLRPVCPNCHAMIHREEPPLAIEELQALLREHSKSTSGA